VVDLFIKKHGVATNYNGLLRMSGRREIHIGDLMAEIRLFVGDRGLPFKAALLNDAAEVWFEKACRERLAAVRDSIAYDQNCGSGRTALRRIAETCFVCEKEGDADFVVAAFNAFIWQVKRKIDELPITDHLMVVLLGRQGNGKSTLVAEMVKPVLELVEDCDFGKITDDKITSIWRSFVGVMDEMKGAKKSDLDSVKNAITSKAMTRRVMRTNKTAIVAQNLTFIGTANADDIQSLIRDETGTRRFLGLQTNKNLDWPLINETDWLSVWKSVDPKTDHPMKPFKTMLAETQAEDRMKTPFEAWIEQMTGTQLFSRFDNVQSRLVDTKLSACGKMGTDILFRDSYTHYEKENFPTEHRQNAMSIERFRRRMATYAQHEGSKFRRHMTDGKTLYSWIG
jgi:hypothetical protein